MAGELSAVALARRAGFYDMWKSIDKEVEGSHVEMIGAGFARKSKELSCGQCYCRTPMAM